MEHYITLAGRDSDAGQLVPARPIRRRSIEKLLVLAALTLGFLLVPAVQGISLVADQSSGASASMQAADAAAAAAVERMIARR